MNKEPLLIIGSGLGGYTLAREVRRLDPSMPIKVITADLGRYYSKPTLSTAYAHQKTPEMLVMADARKMEVGLGIDVHTEARVTRIDVAQAMVDAAGQSFSYSQLVLACGSRPKRIPFLGDGASDLYSINHLLDYERFRERLSQSRRVTIIGSGLVGCEFANDLSRVGFEVTVITPDAYPLQEWVPPKIGHVVSQAMFEAGVRWICDDGVSEIRKIDQRYEILVSSGGKIEADCVVSAVGIVPNIELAEQAGLNIHRGIEVDAYLQTNQKNIYALGDCAEIQGQLWQYVAPINYSAKALAATLTGNPTAVIFPVMPVVVKTSVCPVFMVPAPKASVGEWVCEMDGLNSSAEFRASTGELLGFVLTGKKVLARNDFLSRLSHRWDETVNRK